MKTYGRLIVCDHCGKETFCKETGYNSSIWDRFERAEGWSYVIFIGDLCPRCMKKYHKIMNNPKRLKKFKSRCLRYGRC